MSCAEPKRLTNGKSLVEEAELADSAITRLQTV